MIDENWVFLAVALNMVGAFIYAYSLVKGGIGPMIIFASTFFAKQPKWKITKFDLTCGALSIIVTS